MTHSAHTTVETKKAQRYLKALCNHFDRKVTADYTDDHGTVQFGFGFCEMDASTDKLNIRVQADDSENFMRVKQVVASHLTRFSGEDALEVDWVNLA